MIVTALVVVAVAMLAMAVLCAWLMRRAWRRAWDDLGW
jgi:hypothetical protein